MSNEKKEYRPCFGKTVEDEIKQIDFLSTSTSLYSDKTDEYKSIIDNTNNIIDFLNKEKLITSWASKDELEQLSTSLDHLSILSRYLYNSAKVLGEAVDELKFRVDNTVSFYNSLKPVEQDKIDCFIEKIKKDCSFEQKDRFSISDLFKNEIQEHTKGDYLVVGFADKIFVDDNKVKVIYRNINTNPTTAGNNSISIMALLTFFGASITIDINCCIMEICDTKGYKLITQKEYDELNKK